MKTYSFFNIPEPDGHIISPVLAGFYMFWTMIILLQVLIPISLYVSIEIVKLGQIYFIQSDVDFYNEKMDSTVQCRALNITEDLGQIQYLFLIRLEPSLRIRWFFEDVVWQDLIIAMKKMPRD